MPTALTLTFDQSGLTPGVVDRARTDISSLASETGRAFPVTITIDGIPDGATADIELLDEPPSSNPLLTQVDATHWTLAFDAGVWGPFRVRCRAVTSGRVVASVTRRISIRSPNVGIAYPANAERIDPSANSVASVASVALTEMNEGGTNRPIVDFHRALVEQVEALAVGSIDPTARSAAAAAASTATAAGSAASAAQSTATAAASAASTAASAASAAQSTANGAVPKALYDANTVLIATADDTPIALTMPPSTGLFRLASGNIVAATVAQLQTLLGISAGGGQAWRSIHAKPVTANAEDEEFEGATGAPPSGWTLIRKDTSAVITPTVGVDQWASNISLGAARWEQQRASRPSSLSIQPYDCDAINSGISTQQVLFRPLIATVTNAGATKWSFTTRINRFIQARNLAFTTNDGLTEWGLAADASGKPDFNNRIAFQVRQQVNAAVCDMRSFRVIGGSTTIMTAGSGGLNTPRSQGAGLMQSYIDHFCIAFSANGGVVYFLFGGENRELLASDTLGTTLVFKHVYYAFSTDTGSGGATPAGCYDIDYFRKQTNAVLP